MTTGREKFSLFGQKYPLSPIFRSQPLNYILFLEILQPTYLGENLVKGLEIIKKGNKINNTQIAENIKNGLIRHFARHK